MTSVNVGDEVATKIARLMTDGGYASPEAVVSAALDALHIMRADTEEIRRQIAEADADIAAGRVTSYASADDLVTDVIARGEARSKNEA